MTVKTKEDIQQYIADTSTLVNDTLPDNNTREISPEDLRNVFYRQIVTLRDITDSIKDGTWEL